MILLSVKVVFVDVLKQPAPSKKYKECMSITELQLPDDIVKQMLELWDRNKLRCGWFFREDFTPTTKDDFSRCLSILARNGNRETYVVARKLMKWL